MSELDNERVQVMNVVGKQHKIREVERTLPPAQIGSCSIVSLQVDVNYGRENGSASPFRGLREQASPLAHLQAGEQPDFEPVQGEKINHRDPAHGAKQLGTDGWNMEARQRDECGYTQRHQHAQDHCAAGN